MGVLKRNATSITDFAGKAGTFANARGKCVRRPGLSARYKARPLNGIWATAPYLNNGSVPNLRSLLEEKAKRPNTFFVGSTEFDAKNVGFYSGASCGGTKFDTSQPGNSNAGHEMGVELPDEFKEALLAYLKTL